MNDIFGPSMSHGVIRSTLGDHSAPIDSLLVSFGSLLLTSGLHFLAVGIGVFRQLELILDPCGINSETLRCVGKGIQYAICVC